VQHSSYFGSLNNFKCAVHLIDFGIHSIIKINNLTVLFNHHVTICTSFSVYLFIFIF